MKWPPAWELSVEISAKEAEKRWSYGSADREF
jgi:hypothetical protein